MTGEETLVSQYSGYINLCYEVVAVAAEDYKRAVINHFYDGGKFRDDGAEYFFRSELYKVFAECHNLEFNLGGDEILERLRKQAIEDEIEMLRMLRNEKGDLSLTTSTKKGKKKASVDVHGDLRRKIDIVLAETILELSDCI